jgi:hypothetical protein
VFNLKVRNDFVTNSSSSSFVIAVKEDSLSHDALIVLNEILKSSWDETGEARELNLNDKDELYLLNNEDLEKVKELIKDNWKVYEKNVSYDEQSLSNMLHNLEEKLEGFQIISDYY